MNTSRLDVVFDVYRDRSLKLETRENRGATDTRVSLKKETPLSHKNFSNVLKVGENKTSIFNLISEGVSSKETDALLVSTKESGVVSNQIQGETNLAPCNQEEADTRIFLRCAYLMLQRKDARRFLLWQMIPTLLLSLYVCSHTSS